MGKVIYGMNVSLDGYVETPDHSLDWANVNEALHTWFNDGAREADAFVWGRRMYDLMVAYWPNAESDPSATEAELDFARIANAKPKIVFSTSLTSVEWKGRLVSGNVDDELARLRSEFDGDLDIGGPALASQFIRRGLVDEYRLVVHPVVLGAGTPFFPGLERPIGLRLKETRTFESGVIYLGYVSA
jgi:dihydrofolate reductase